MTIQKEIFLATTALEEFWIKDQEILFIGKWCLLYSQKDELEKLSYTVFPDIWSERKKLITAWDYCDKTYENVLSILVEVLNKIHNVNHGVRYWRILLGPWLYVYNQMIFDRYSILLQVKESYPNIYSIGLKKEDFVVPTDTNDFWWLFTDDSYNLQIFTQLIKILNIKYKCKSLSKRLKGNIERIISKTSILKNKVKKNIEIILNQFSYKSDIILTDFNVPFKSLLSLCLKTKFKSLPFTLDKPDYSGVEHDIELRNRFLDMFKDIELDKYEQCLIKTLMENIPLCYLEGYPILKDSINKYIKYNPKAIVTSGGFWFNERIKILSAIWSEGGTQLVAVQHGGGYRSMNKEVFEHVETKLSDYFFSWGWTYNNSGKVKALPNPKMSLYKSSPFPQISNGEDYCLFLTYSYPRYFYLNMSTYIGEQIEIYIENQIKFINNLKKNIFKSIIIRLYHVEFGWKHFQRLNDKVEGLKFDSNPIPNDFIKRLSKAKIVICDQNQTTYLESLVINKPTILFWDSYYNEIKEEEKYYFNLLKQVGILYDSPEQAALKLNQIYNDPNEWWFSSSVQNARKIFINRFALTDNNWLNIWADVLLKLNK